MNFSLWNKWKSVLKMTFDVIIAEETECCAAGENDTKCKRFFWSFFSFLKKPDH